MAGEAVEVAGYRRQRGVHPGRQSLPPEAAAGGVSDCLFGRTMCLRRWCSMQMCGKPAKSRRVRAAEKAGALKKGVRSPPATRTAFESEVQKGRSFSYARPRLQAPSKPGASASRICSRARKSLVFTFDSERSITSAVSLMLRCWISRRINTVRYFSGREFKAWVSASRSSFCSRASDGISRQSAKSFGM